MSTVNSAVRLLQELITIPSPTGEEAAVTRFLSEYLSGQGFRVELQPVSGDRQNIFAYFEKPAPIVFCTHLDTVLPVLGPSVDGETIFGRGACDAKGAVAAMVEASLRLSEEGTRVALLFLVGEERDSDGARRAVELEIGSRYVVLGEPTDNRVAVGQKGTLVFRIATRGRAGHSAYPSLGHSAIHKLVEVLSDWQHTDWGSSDAMGACTLNVGKIEGGVGPNVIAEKATAEGIFRVATSVKEIKSRIERFLDGTVVFEVLSSSEPIRLTPVPGLEETIVSFGSDAPYLRHHGEVILCGPGSIAFAHSPDEQIRISDLLAGVETYVRIGQELSRRIGS